MKRFLAFSLLLVCFQTQAADSRPNIVWIVTEDMSPHFGCYGEKSIRTPHVDQLAAEGTRFSRAFVTAPICSISRSAMITGMYQTSIGAQHHRSGRGKLKIHLPEGVELVPALFKKAGYWTCNGSGENKGGGKDIGKTDYNFEWDEKATYDGNDWKGRAAGQPFFAQVQLVGGKLRDGARCREVVQKALGSLTKPDDLPLPPYYPRTKGILEDWALTLDACRYTDHQVGQVVQRLKDEGVLENTVIIFITDHGVSHARGKQFLYDEGTHIPFIMRGPGVEKGKVRDDLIEHMDMAATSLALAGIPIPAKMQARNILAKDYVTRGEVFAARDRADETVDHIRSIRTVQYRYIRNYLPQRPHLQPNNYKDNKPCLIALRKARDEGVLDEVQKMLFAPTRPKEELYDVDKDPWQIHNLAADPAYAEPMAEFRASLQEWEEKSPDMGRTPESPEMYDSEMAAYVGEKKGKGEGRRTQVEENIALMKKWAAEGK
jgi:arylsulfatase A-like enzyme